MQINYLIIDDEPIAHTLIEKFADELDYMKLIGNCHNAMSALPLLKTQQVDLIFLDINMPKLNGFEFLKTLANPPQIIIISAHKEHALESYEYTIADYLLKPFNFERFFKSIQKVMGNISTIPEPTSSTDLPIDKSIFIKDEKKNHKVALSDIDYIKAEGNYTSVNLKNRHILSQMKISDFEKLLPKEDFSRIHRSYIVAHQAMTLISANEIKLDDTSLPIGRVYKGNIRHLIENNLLSIT
ncbi:LytR/AlgR family response regulator transcription factor [Cognaticolwellia mytili]|uniref:LytR/AlgR family response regulator transcription factor n=1 Tax=Cognaticolwellia mytili TaxID=1888913 RepID=UPI001B8008CE|nr:LytTR family DNA-binding domain-containing protein [Cognaticolwellia mytili]